MKPSILKNILSLVLILTGTFNAHAELKVVATLSTFGDLVDQVGGEHVSVHVVAPPTFNPHFIDPRPSDVLKLKRADVFIHGGLDLELWKAPLLTMINGPICWVSAT